MVIFHSYVSLPEGKICGSLGHFDPWPQIPKSGTWCWAPAGALQGVSDHRTLGLAMAIGKPQVMAIGNP
jgi:hypothetical protein